MALKSEVYCIPPTIGDTGHCVKGRQQELVRNKLPIKSAGINHSTIEKRRFILDALLHGCAQNCLLVSFMTTYVTFRDEKHYVRFWQHNLPSYCLGECKRMRTHVLNMDRICIEEQILCLSSVIDPGKPINIKPPPWKELDLVSVVSLKGGRVRLYSCFMCGEVKSGGYKEMSPILADQYRPSYMSPNAGAWGWGSGVSANENSCAHHVTWIQNKLWRFNSVFNRTLTQISL
jgi:hypothetical protein